ncbi:MAG: radical SAM protein [Nanoarchaeota archaeon]|nr:radical SAM protein [Nanoarchaeota archaeon]
MNVLLVYLDMPVKSGIPLSLAYVAAVLRERGDSVNIVDLRYQKNKEIYNLLSLNKYGIVGVYSSSEVALDAINLAKALKPQLNDSVLVVGGPHATIDPGFFLDAFDVVVKGEGEKTILELAEKIEKKKAFSNVKGIVFKRKNKLIDTGKQDYIKNLDDLPFPAYDLFPNFEESLIKDTWWAFCHPACGMLVSRGCPYRCTFCQPTLEMMFGTKIRRMSPKRIVEHMKFLKEKYKIKEIYFHDDLLLHIAWRKWFYELADLMIKEKVDLIWTGQVRANSTDIEMLKKAKSCGCYGVTCGVESGSEKVLDFYNKQAKPEDVIKLFSDCKKLGLTATAAIIFGAPVETIEEANKTVELVKKIKPDGVSTNILTPYPGTYICTWLENNNILYEKGLGKITRAVQHQKIKGPLSNDQLLDFMYSIELMAPSLKYIIIRPYYRKVYFRKLWNLISRKEYKNSFRFIVSTFTQPFMNKIKKYYFKRGNKSKLIVSAKKLISNS